MDSAAASPRRSIRSAQIRWVRRVRSSKRSSVLSRNAADVASTSRLNGPGGRGGELRAPRKLWHTAARSLGPAGRSMTLLVRINLALTACFLLAALAAGGVCHLMLQANAKREVMREAALMVDSALAMRAY